MSFRRTLLLLVLVASAATLGACGKKDQEQERNSPAAAAEPMPATPTAAPGAPPAASMSAKAEELSRAAPAEPAPAPQQLAEPARPMLDSGDQRGRSSANVTDGARQHALLESSAGRRGTEDEPVPPTPSPEPRRELVRTFYLSNDDSMSLSSAQRIEYAIEKGLPVPREHIRPHELLNYYAFETEPVPEGETFSVQAELAPGESGGYTLSLAVRGRDVTREQRQPLVLTLVLDVSGSMRDEGKMEFLQRGLLALLDQLKDGDVVNVVAFNQKAREVVKNFAVEGGDLGRVRRAIEGLRPGGSTDLDQGLTLGYELAERAYDEGKNNRVLLVTDARANTGTTDERLIAEVGRRYDERKIRLSGIGVGADFNDSLLDRLTERGKGAYVFVGSASVVDRVFGAGFVSLVETVAVDVRFRLELPESLALERFYGEEVSEDRSRVQAIHYFAGTTQEFLSDLALGTREPEATDSVSMTIEFTDPATGLDREKKFAFRVGDVLGDPSHNVRKARLLMAWARHLADVADHDLAQDATETAKASDACRDAATDLRGRAGDLTGDVDVGRVLELMDLYCERFASPSPPRPSDDVPSPAD